MIFVVGIFYEKESLLLSLGRTPKATHNSLQGPAAGCSSCFHARMAKQILLRVLQNYLGKWLDGITSENLKYGVWSGTMHLQDLRIKPEVRLRAGLD